MRYAVILFALVTVGCSAGPTDPTVTTCHNDKSLPADLDPGLVKVIRECRYGLDPVPGYTWVPAPPEQGGGGYHRNPDVPLQ